jgi:hypothetical protein
MNSTELASFISQVQGRLKNIEDEWGQWRSLVSVQPRSQDLWSSSPSSGEWICLGQLRCSQNILPLELNQPIQIGSSADPFQSIHLRNRIHFHNPDGGASIQVGNQPIWQVDRVGCQGFGAVPDLLAAQFHFVGRGQYQLSGVEVGRQWIRVHFPSNWPPEKKQIHLFFHLHDWIQPADIQDPQEWFTIQRWIEPDRAELNRPIPDHIWDEWTGDQDSIQSVVKTILVQPVWLAGHLTPEQAIKEETPFLLIHPDGRVAFQHNQGHQDHSADTGESLIWNGSARFNDTLTVSRTIHADSLRIQSKELIPNLNAELWNGFRSPQQGEVVSTLDPQTLLQKSFGDDVKMNGHRLMQLGEPIYRDDAATRGFVESWVQGIQPKKPARCITPKTFNPNNAHWDSQKQTWTLHTSSNLPELIQTYFDGLDELKLHDSVLVLHQEQEERHGLFIVSSLQETSLTLERRNDFTHGIPYRSLKGSYVWITHGTRYGGTAWVCHPPQATETENQTQPQTIWKKGEPLEFHLYYEVGAHRHQFGLGFHHDPEGKIQLHHHTDFFRIGQQGLTLLEQSINPSRYLKTDFIDWKVGNGLWIDKKRTHLGDRIELQLQWNPSQFLINEKNEVSLLRPNQSYRLDSGRFVEWVNPVRCVQPMEIENELTWVQQLSAPLHFKAEFKLQTNTKNNTNDEAPLQCWVQYWIAAYDKDKKLTTAISSPIGYEEVYPTQGDKWFVKLSWSPVEQASGYKVWRIRSSSPFTETMAIQFLSHQQFTKNGDEDEDEDSQPQLHQLELPGKSTYCLDILYPFSFQKLQWKEHDGLFPTQNQTRTVFGRLSTNLTADKHNGFVGLPFGLGTLNPDATILELKESQTNQTQAQKPAIHILTQPIPNRSAQIRWDTIGSSAMVIPYTMEFGFGHQHQSRLSFGASDTMIQLAGEKHRIWITPEGWKKPHSSTLQEVKPDDTLCVMDGGIYSEGRIASKAPDGFETEQTTIPGNPALLKTGTLASEYIRSVANGLCFAWKGTELNAIPMNDGKPSGSSVPIKQFTIQHPIHEDRWLQHACLEGPTADIYQRGSCPISVESGSCYVSLPAYWWELVEPDTMTVQLTPRNGPIQSYWWSLDKENHGLRVHWHRTQHSSNFNGVIRNEFGEMIYIDYMIQGRRKDARFNPEPLKTDVVVHRVGPYSWTG